MSDRLDLDVQDLPMDVFDLSGTGLEIETLTTGHGMQEHAASTGSMPCSWNSSCCCGNCADPLPYTDDTDDLE
ncbi:thiomuracin/GE37468 family thiazolyl RiPP peptide [Streptomyces sp. NPDC056716]|uniref:thiomuracin/GE37468 family thiazolyl RiPP peptide n=1 Tax=unclassified Streptomyces TaxID=2593676 RepID=UPI0036C84B41